MFRFTIRELLLLTVIVAMGVGWWLRERELRSELAKALPWRMRAGGLERIVDNFGYDVTWDADTQSVTVKQRKDFHVLPLYCWEYTSLYEPSADKPQPSSDLDR